MKAGKPTYKADPFTKNWITENAIEIISEYDYGVLTIRGLHYRLVARGMTNSMRHYKRVVDAMGQARWAGTVDFEVFSDHDREILGKTNFEPTNLEDSIETGKSQIRAWMHHYSKNRWENQPYYPEIFIEKKALQGVFQSVCNENDVALGACKGYPSLTFLNDSARRFNEAERVGKQPIILYFGDYDPSGEDIPRAIEENLVLGCNTIEVRRIALLHDQVVEWELPPAPVKDGDSRSANWNGLGQVELDAVEPNQLRRLCQEAIDSIFDRALFADLEKQEEDEQEEYRAALKTYVTGL